MKKTLLVVASLLVSTCLLAAAAPKPPAKNGAIERGRYLVEQVAACGECHTPRDAEGRLDNSRWLQGGPTWFTPIHASTTWAYSAPALAGLPSFSDQDMTTILEKGLQPDGRPIRPPMHVYHLAPEDVQAIIAYLRSLAPLAR